ncbi:Serine/threonine-protein kinase ppk5 [Durusdinium trenchii]|uniref:Serine/threonine-protein kinase ppk5 n=1 Tax=Durusdinium trenchii TaxID=1381693 RepID=A0ABP0IFV4_9DINO
MRKGTGFVAMENLPDSDESEDELLEEAPAAQPGRKVSFSSEGGIDVQKAHAMRKGTGFVATENLPETDESEGEGEGTREIEVPTNPPERKVSFSQEVGIDGLQANTLRKGTGFVPMANLPDSEDEEEEDDCDYEEDDFDPEDSPKTTGSEA